MEVGKDGKTKPKAKYLGAPGSSNRLYFPPGITREQLADPSIPVILVEGEKKALALQRLACHDCENLRFIPVGIAGVWNWRGTVGKTGGPRGERLDVKGPINDLGHIVWTGRSVSILFDANVHTNESVKWARTGLSRALKLLNAEVGFVNLPEDCGVNGVDDLLGVWGPDRVLELIRNPTGTDRIHIVQNSKFEATPDGLTRISTRGEQSTRTPLTNYTAKITANICVDDGVEQEREFELECELAGRSFTFSLSARQFASMDWPLEKMGARAITQPNLKDYARTAIQALSIAAEDRQVYRHSGWRKVGERWMFLHAGGAIDQDGTVPGINVRLLGVLSRYQLPGPPSGETLVSSVRATLQLARLGPSHICFPLLASVFRAVLDDADFSLHLAGPTGAFKSELAALFQQFFGPEMTRKNLPGSWSSTGNALEGLAFYAKHVLLTIDDFAPQGSLADIARYHSNADKVFRAAGNRSARGRMDSSARLREAKPPRSLILSTGEEIPQGQSVRGRLLILELSKGVITSANLSECQRKAMEGRYAEAMAGFLHWLAGSYELRHEAFKQRAGELRIRAMQNAAHARTPEIVAGLTAALELYLEFSEECGAITDELRRDLSDQCWNALLEAAAAQAQYQLASEPAARYLSLLAASLSSGQAHLAARNGVAPEMPGSCGWRCNATQWEPQGRRIGWTDGSNIYIEPTAAYELVQSAARNSGEGFAIGEQMLRKRLHERKLLASIDETRGTLTIRRTLEGSSKNVLHFLRTTLLPDQLDDEGGDGPGNE